jgi:hypothetical protein
MTNETFDPTKNEWLKLRPNIIRGFEEVDKVIVRLDKYFGMFKHEAWVTSIVRLPSDQLRIIIDYANKHNIPVNFKVEDVEKKLPNGNYIWQETWSLLLNKGIIINPPIAAKVLHDYIKNGENRKGQIIPPSPHFFGRCFDISGSSNGIDDELKIINSAITQDPILGKLILKITPERVNNALHIDVKVS